MLIVVMSWTGMSKSELGEMMNDFGQGIRKNARRRDDARRYLESEGEENKG